MKPYHHLKQSGVSLIEIMIALAIGIILTMGAVSIFISNNNIARLETQLSNMQASGRFLIDVLSMNVRMAGYNGCSSRGAVEVNYGAGSPSPLPIEKANAVRGFNANSSTWQPTMPAGLQTALTAGGADAVAVTGTDVLNVQGVECAAYLNGTWSGASPIEVVMPSNDCGLDANKPVIIYHCSGAEVFQPNSVTTSGAVTSIHFSGTLRSGLYDTDATVSLPRSRMFYIAENTDNERGLYMASWEPDDGDTLLEAEDFQVRQLAEGVQDMQITYGVAASVSASSASVSASDNAPYAGEYQTADVVGDGEPELRSIRSVRIDLLLQSDDNVTSEPRRFLFNGADANTGSDRRLRLAFSTTIALRNSLP